VDPAIGFCASGCTEAAGNLLLDFEHPQVLLGLVVVEGNGEIV
jgi:hypothetical protein